MKTVSPATLVSWQCKALLGRVTQQEGGMHINLRSLWIGLIFQQVRGYRRVATVLPKRVEASWPLAPQTRRDCGPSRRHDLLNPLEFHGKRPSQQGAPQPPAGQRTR